MHFDQTQITSSPTDPTPSTPHPSSGQPVGLLPRGERADRIILGVSAVVAVVLMLIGTWVLASDGGDSAEASSAELPADDLVIDPADPELASATTVPTSVPEPEPQPEPEPAPEPEPQPEPAPEPEPVPQPEPNPEPVGPCDVLADGQTLAVTPGPVELPVGTYAGELAITNCGEPVTGWSASTLAPAVQLGVDQGLLAPGATVDLQFAVDASQIDGTSMFFTIEISEPGFETGVMVKVTKPIINPELLIDPEILLQP